MPCWFGSMGDRFLPGLGSFEKWNWCPSKFLQLQGDTALGWARGVSPWVSQRPVVPLSCLKAAIAFSQSSQKLACSESHWEPKAERRVQASHPLYVVKMYQALAQYAVLNLYVQSLASWLNHRTKPPLRALNRHQGKNQKVPRHLVHLVLVLPMTSFALTLIEMNGIRQDIPVMI